MKIEKISDNQIRCTLSREDLVDRELRISELAYGTEKAKALFREMMQQASHDFGFEADDIPLMIEAIPVSTESLILVITKVEDPDELDTRFSKFSPIMDEEDSFITDDEEDAYADEIIHSYQNNEVEDDSMELPNSAANPLTTVPRDNNQSKGHDNTTRTSSEQSFTKVFTFPSLDAVIQLAENIVFFYRGVNTLYKNPSSGLYYLEVSKSDHTPEEFNKVCNIMSEFGNAERTTYASTTYYKEHFEHIVTESAIQILSVM